MADGLEAGFEASCLARERWEGTTAVVRRKFGPNAQSRTAKGSHSKFEFTIRVPETTDIQVRQDAGELDVEGHFGQLDLNLSKGDAKVRVISAASILAKVARDEAMLKYHEQFPQYGFDTNKGYLTEFHLATLKQFGPCPIHRQNYEPIRSLLAGGPVERQLDLLRAEA